MSCIFLRSRIAKGRLGSLEILAVDPMFDKSDDSWRVFFRKLKARGMKRTALVVSDAHACPEFDKKRISSTNRLERLNTGIRRRSRIWGVSPTVASYVWPFAMST